MALVVFFNSKSSIIFPTYCVKLYFSFSSEHPLSIRKEYNINAVAKLLKKDRQLMRRLLKSCT